MLFSIVCTKKWKKEKWVGTKKMEKLPHTGHLWQAGKKCLTRCALRERCCRCCRSAMSAFDSQKKRSIWQAASWQTYASVASWHNLCSRWQEKYVNRFLHIARSFRVLQANNFILLCLSETQHKAPTHVSASGGSFECLCLRTAAGILRDLVRVPQYVHSPVSFWSWIVVFCYRVNTSIHRHKSLAFTADVCIFPCYFAHPLTLWRFDSSATPTPGLL